MTQAKSFALDMTAHSDSTLNLAQLLAELEWLSEVINAAVSSYLQQYEDISQDMHWCEIELPEHQIQGAYGALVAQWHLDRFERLAIALTLAVHLKPQALDLFFGVNGFTNRRFSEFGGINDASGGAFIPTGQTLAFLICGNDTRWRGHLMNVLSREHHFYQQQVIELESPAKGMPTLSGMLSLSDTWLQYFLTGQQQSHHLSASFPAHHLTTDANWPDLVLEPVVMRQVNEIKTWIEHGDTLMNDWGLKSKIKPGYRALFFGPPGTGKTMTAALLGKSTGRDVYRVDLSMIVSKYIGETEKNLSKVFDIAANNQWILFFDEADALFGKRTEASNSNDRYANQQTGYLLQRIEDFPGIVILASNLKANMDEAFTRRFQAMIHFTMPEVGARLTLWQNAFAESCELADDVDLLNIATEHELAGGAIINVLRYCALAAIARGSRKVQVNDIKQGIKREFKKDNRTI